MPPHGIVSDGPTPPLSGRKVEDQLLVDVGGAHRIEVEEDDWGGSVNQDPMLVCLMSAVQTRSGSRRRFGDTTTDGIQ
jgi:hypothetical protein